MVPIEEMSRGAPLIMKGTGLVLVDMVDGMTIPVFYQVRRDDSSHKYSQRHKDQPRDGYSRHHSEHQDQPTERQARHVNFEDGSRPWEAAGDHRETVSDVNLSREESESVISVVIQIYPIVRPCTIRDCTIHALDYHH